MTRYTEDQLKEMGFEIEDGWKLKINGPWVTTDEVPGGGTIDLEVEYLFQVADPDENRVYDIDDKLYAMHARVLSIDFWNGEGQPPFEVGEEFDTLDMVTFEDCKG